MGARAAAVAFNGCQESRGLLCAEELLDGLHYSKDRALFIFFAFVVVFPLTLSLSFLYNR